MYTLKVIRNGKVVDEITKNHVETLILIMYEYVIPALEVYGEEIECDWKFVIQKNKKRGAK